jgi:hypothetical protein
MAKGNPLLYRFNRIITSIFESGLYEKWKNDFMSSSRLDNNPFDDNDTNFLEFTTIELNTDNPKFSLYQLQGVFYMLLIGQLFSTLVFLIEILYHRACTTAATSTARYSPQGDQKLGLNL